MSKLPEPKATRILYTDRAEYYYVCANCHAIYRGMQWSGSTRGYPDWRDRAIAGLERAKAAGQACEFCGDRGNGGWQINGHFVAAEARDKRLAHNLAEDQDHGV